MSAGFASQLRVSGDRIIRMAPEGAPALRVRAQVAERWDIVRVDATANTPVAAVKEAALRELEADAAANPAEYIVKLRGWEVLDEQQSLGQAGIVDGSTLLLHYRRRRPVR